MAKYKYIEKLQILEQHYLILDDDYDDDYDNQRKKLTKIQHKNEIVISA